MPSKCSRVLIIEDNADGRRSLEILVRLWGHQVEVADDGLEGLRKVLVGKPDIAIVDIQLPALNGYQIARTVKRNLGKQVFLIALTANGARQESLDAGFDEHITKPADLENLHELIARWPYENEAAAG
jgi:CheY-like chemotaxis protein